MKRTHAERLARALAELDKPCSDDLEYIDQVRYDTARRPAGRDAARAPQRPPAALPRGKAGGMNPHVEVETARAFGTLVGDNKAAPPSAQTTGRGLDRNLTWRSFP